MLLLIVHIKIWKLVCIKWNLGRVMIVPGKIIFWNAIYWFIYISDFFLILDLPRTSACKTSVIHLLIFCRCHIIADQRRCSFVSVASWMVCLNICSFLAASAGIWHRAYHRVDGWAGNRVGEVMLMGEPTYAGARIRKFGKYLAYPL
jgi:hypothetical protein